MTEFLSIHNLSKHFEGLAALDSISLQVEENSVISLIGPNGAGKTTFFNCITGMTQPSSGEIFFREETLVSLKPYQIARQGIARTFQNIRLFPEMTLLENVIVGRHLQSALPLIKTFTGALLQSAGFKEREEQTRIEALDLLDFVGLKTRHQQSARHLPYGDQRRLEIARALALDPKLLLLDEPAAGMNPQETADLMTLIAKIKDRGITPFLIEHNMHLVMGISDKIVVLDHGEKIAEGLPSEIRENPRVIEAYLGGAPN